MSYEPQARWTLEPGGYTLYLTVWDAQGLADTQEIFIVAIAEKAPEPPAPP